ncbi:Methylated-DNA--protein-cysteine methyltransferase [Candidatus Lokiarchaeum ossiferum]|uniref:Methylated-DNA--protein-cysteine methyltransferase n=1 Tax=Candidatus Lokiarchaeum ossiferum TaxID=2951803 RepID=A0ABY6HWJ7_9ARCH|nr:Methylated-DNA--protein-cysteine methyltransferase [Candidatus Lokiarchaeum sp. B-35]
MVTKMPTPFTMRVIEIIQNIPVGKVSTYGSIARLAGSPRGARQVSWALHSMTEKYALPWHRVINSQGKLVLKSDASCETQKALLEKEGVEVGRNFKVDLKKYLWDGNS